MENHLKRVLNLVRKTGDTIVVVDKEGNDSFVVMNLDHYESLLDDSPASKPEIGPNIWDVMQEAGNTGETWDIDQLGKDEVGDLEKQYQAFARGHVQQVVEEVQIAKRTQESQNGEKKKESLEDDDYGEEQFYLEPVE